MSLQFQCAKSIFLQALDNDSAIARDRFVQEACGDDKELRDLVFTLLDAHCEPGRFLRGQDTSLAKDNRTEQVGQQIGPYKLREKIGEGGFGVVYVAEQKEPVSRKVALKVIKPGMDSQDIIARFEAERQALAMMDHPNVAKVLDAGSTESGHPYFVMELVHGVAITAYCDSKKMTNRQRLELFIDVCHAVQHAHQKGIIHRDLKPSNVMVTMADQKPVVKVIDFGVAKALHRDLTDKSIYTGYGQMVGTPMYMSPEQAQMSSMDVDTRSDIYSLGVLLYELLAGTTPFDKEAFRKAGFDELRRMIREVEPRRPSDQVSTFKAEQVSTISECRSVEPGTLRKSLRGDLDWIVMKTLEKDRTRRYETANGLAADLKRFLDNEPVIACPPTKRYLIHKFVQRNRLQVTAVALVLLTITLGIIGTSYGMWLANQRLSDSELARKREVTAKLGETKQRNIAEGITSFFKDDFLALASVNTGDTFDGLPLFELTANLTFRDLLDRAAQKLDSQQGLDPLIEAELRRIIGESYRGLALYNSAIQFLEQSVALYRRELGIDSETTLDVRFSLAQTYENFGRYGDAEDILISDIQRRRKLRGSEHPDTLAYEFVLADLYQGLDKPVPDLARLEKFVGILETELGPIHRNTLFAKSVLAAEYANLDLKSKAIEVSAQIVRDVETKWGPNHIEVLRRKIGLAGFYMATEQHADSRRLLENVMKVLARISQEMTPESLAARRLLAKSYELAGDSGKAQSSITSLIEKLEQVLPADHPKRLECDVLLAGTLAGTEQQDDAIELLRKVLSAQEQRLGKNHVATITTMQKLVDQLGWAGEYEESLRLQEEVVQRIKTAYGENHSNYVSAMLQLADTALARFDEVRAMQIFEEMMPRIKDHRGEMHDDTLFAMLGLGFGYVKKGQVDRGIKMMEEVYQALTAKYGPTAPHTLRAFNGIATAFFFANRLDESIPRFEKLLQIQEQSLGRDNVATLTTIGNLGANYSKAGRYEDALLLLQEAYHTDVDGPNKLFGGELAKVLTKMGQLDKAKVVANKHLQFSRRNLPQGSTLLTIQFIQLCNGYFLPASEFATAEKLLRESLVALEKNPPDDYSVFIVRSALGEALSGLNQLEEAQTNLLAAHDGLMEHRSAMPPNKISWIDRTFERLIVLYESWNKSEPGKEFDAKATAWKQRHKEYQADIKSAEPSSDQPDK